MRAWVGLGENKMNREAYGLGEERVQLEARLEGLTNKRLGKGNKGASI